MSNDYAVSITQGSSLKHGMFVENNYKAGKTSQVN